MLVAPSVGFGGGIERVAAAIEANWPGRLSRLNLYESGTVARPEGNLRAKARLCRKIVATAIKEQPNCILGLHVNFLLPVLLAGRLTRAKTAMFAHGVEVWKPLPALTRWAVSRCDRLLAISSFTARWFAKRAEIDLGRVKVVHLPIDNALLSAARTEAPEERGADRTIELLSVTRLVPEHRYKGCFDVADALSLLVPRRSDLRWTVAGHGEDLPVLESHCKHLGISGAVRLTGRISDAELIDLYRRSDVFVLPSFADPEADPPVGEGFGLVYAEAAAFGMPAVASSSGGGALEFVEHEVTGLTVRRHDPETLAQTLERLVDDAELRKRLGRSAAQRVFERHLPDEFGRALMAALS